MRPGCAWRSWCPAARSPAGSCPRWQSQRAGGVSRRCGAGGPGRAARPAARAAGYRPGVTRARAGGALDRDRCCQPGSPTPAGRRCCPRHRHQPVTTGRVPPAAVTWSRTPGPYRAGHLVDHLQRQPPLLAVPDVVREAGLLAAAPRPGRLHRVVQGLRPTFAGRTTASPPRTRHARSPGARPRRPGSSRSCPASRNTAAPHTATRPRPSGSPCRRPPAPPPAGQPRTTGPVRPHRRVIPGRRRDELLQPLMVNPQPCGHRLHRLALPVGQQPARIQLARGTLILARQVTEHLRGEVRQPGPDLRDLLRSHPGMTLQKPRQPPTT